VNQVGSLGSGNHFLEVQRVAEIYDRETAVAYGLGEDQIVVMIHSGSRGLGHQTCTEYLRRFEREYPDIAQSLPDRQLIYAPAGRSGSRALSEGDVRGGQLRVGEPPGDDPRRADDLH